MKLLVLCYEYPPIGGGGGRMAHNIAAALARRGWEIRVQTSWLPGLPRAEVRDGVHIFRSFAFRGRADRCTVPEMAGYLAGALFPSLRHIRQWRPDGVHAHFAVPTGALALACKQLTGVPYVLTAHLGDLPGGNPEQTANWFRLLGPLIRPIWNNAGAATASSSFAAGLAREAYGVQPRLIPNGIDMKGKRAAPNPPSSPLRLTAIGRFQPQKNFPWMMEALGGCPGPWKLELIGDGEQAEDIREAMRRAGIGDRVALRGWLPEDAMRQTLDATDVLLMPSTSEGTPVAAIEALKRGVALLCSDVPGLADLIEDGGNGFAVPIAAFEPFRARLAELLRCPELLLKMKSRSMEMAARFDIERIAGEFETLLLQTFQPGVP